MIAKEIELQQNPYKVGLLASLTECRRLPAGGVDTRKLSFPTTDDSHLDAPAHWEVAVVTLGPWPSPRRTLQTMSRETNEHCSFYR